MQDKIEQLKQLVERSNKEAGTFSRNGFGLAIADPDQYCAISKEELARLESEYGLALPQEYKEYVTTIANGGNHPLMGLFTVQDSLALNRMNRTDFDRVSGKLFIQRYLESGDYEVYSDRNSKDLLKQFEVKEFGKVPVLDDYFDSDIKEKTNTNETLVFKDFIEWKPEPEGVWNEYRESMLKHLLLLSYGDYYRTEIGLVLDGKYVGEVVYIPHDFGSHLILTHLNFLDWMIGYYAHELEHKPGKYIFFW